MPSAVAKKEEIQNLPAPGEHIDPIAHMKQAGMNKIRNLEKRKNKLESLRDESLKGKALTEEQKLAVSQLVDVDRQIELSKEFMGNIQSVESIYNKQQKALKKKEKEDRSQTELSRLRELLRLQDLLNSLGNESVRQDFLAGSNGALKLTQEELKRYDDVYKKICPTREDMSDGQVWSHVLDESAQFALNLIVSLPKSAPGFESMNYKLLKEHLEKLATCSYFESKPSLTATAEQGEPATSERVEEEHRRIEPTNSFDSSEHSATPSLYAATTNAVNGGSNQQQEQPQRYRSPSDILPSAAINFLQEDQTGTPANVAMAYVPMQPPGILNQTNYGQAGQDYSAYNFAANQQQMNSSQIDAYKSYNQVFPDLTSMNAPVIGQPTQLQLDVNAHTKHLDQTVPPVYDSQQGNVNYNEATMVSSTNANQKTDNLMYNNAEGVQNQPDSSGGFPEASEFHRGRGYRGGRRGGGYRGDGFRGTGRGGNWRGARNDGSHDRNERGGGGNYGRNERGGGGSYERNERSGGGNYERNDRGGFGGPRGGGYRRGGNDGEYRGGNNYRGGFGATARGGGADRPRGRGRGGARGGDSARDDARPLVDGGQV